MKIDYLIGSSGDSWDKGTKQGNNPLSGAGIGPVGSLFLGESD
jgi:hypothetical protein